VAKAIEVARDIQITVKKTIVQLELDEMEVATLLLIAGHVAGSHKTSLRGVYKNIAESIRSTAIGSTIDMALEELDTEEMFEDDPTIGFTDDSFQRARMQITKTLVLDKI